MRGGARALRLLVVAALAILVLAPHRPAPSISPVTAEHTSHVLQLTLSSVGLGPVVLNKHTADDQWERARSKRLLPAALFALVATLGLQLRSRRRYARLQNGVRWRNVDAPPLLRLRAPPLAL